MLNHFIQSPYLQNELRGVITEENNEPDTSSPSSSDRRITVAYLRMALKKMIDTFTKTLKIMYKGLLPAKAKEPVPRLFKVKLDALGGRKSAFYMGINLEQHR